MTNLFPAAIKIAARTIGLDLVTVVPLSAPVNQMFYTDFKYGTILDVRKKRKEKLEKLNNIFRKEKLKYIEEILKKII